MRNSEKTLTRQSRPLTRWFNSPMDRFFKNDFFDLWDGERIGMETLPSLNIREDKNNFLVELAAPGLKKDDFNINVEGNVVTVSCDKEPEVRETKENGYMRTEYDYSCFSRSFTLPENADANNIHAKYSEGILNLEIPKKEQVQKENAKKIKVE